MEPGLGFDVLVIPLKHKAIKWKGKHNFKHGIALRDPFNARIIAQMPNTIQRAQSKYSKKKRVGVSDCKMPGISTLRICESPPMEIRKR